MGLAGFNSDDTGEFIRWALGALVGAADEDEDRERLGSEAVEVAAEVFEDGADDRREGGREMRGSFKRCRMGRRYVQYLFDSMRAERVARKKCVCRK